MISRVAESCFWLQRYVERADSTSRLLSTNAAYVLEAGIAEKDRWRPVIVVSGEEEHFLELHRARDLNDGDVVQEYMSWDTRNPVSIVSSVWWARENARTIREVITREAFETVNGLWHWTRGGAGRRAYGRGPDDFYQHVKDVAAQFQGVCQNTMAHSEPFDFMRLGMLLERAMQTARILDVKHHMLGPTKAGALETPAEAAQWTALLQSCSALEAFYRRSPGAPTARGVVDFLVLERTFPRSILHCLDRARNFLRRIRENAPPEVGERSGEMLGQLLEGLEQSTIDELLERGIHAELTRLVDRTSDLCGQIHADLFDPALLPGGTSGARARQTQVQ